MNYLAHVKYLEKLSHPILLNFLSKWRLVNFVSEKITLELKKVYNKIKK